MPRAAAGQPTWWRNIRLAALLTVGGFAFWVGYLAPLDRRSPVAGAKPRGPWLRALLISRLGTKHLASSPRERACISVIIEGRFSQRFASREYDCGPGTVLAKPPEERHADEWLAPRSRHVIIEPHPGALNALGPVARAVDQVHFLLDGDAFTVAQHIVRELDDPDDLTPMATEALALQLMARVGRRSETTAMSAPPWLLRIRDHRRRVRLEAAKNAPAATDKSISQVAFDCGFSDQSHLTRRLKRATGLTPLDYRKALGSS